MEEWAKSKLEIGGLPEVIYSVQPLSALLLHTTAPKNRISACKIWQNEIVRIGPVL